MLIRLKHMAAKLIVLGLMLLTLMAINRPAVANAQSAEDSVTVPSSDPATPLPAFTGTSDPLIQQRELAAYIQANGLSARVAQVDLEQFPKISQYADIDTSASGYGFNACGLVAAAAALGGPDWTPLVGSIADAAGADYSAASGIQPSRYVAALPAVFGADTVAAMNAATLGDLYRELSAGRIVIVDIQVNANTEWPSADAPNYAHFARVLGIDVDKGEVYIENTLSGGPYWTLSLSEFVQVWDHPETAVSLIPDPQNAEPVTRWMVILDDVPTL